MARQVQSEDISFQHFGNTDEGVVSFLRLKKQWRWKMRKYASLLALAIILIWVGSSYAEVHKCAALGYQVDLPTGWQALDLQKMQADPKILESAVENANKGPWKTANRDLTGNVQKMLNSGRIEYYMNPQYPNSVISVNETQGKLPKTDAEVISVCESLPWELSSFAGKPIQVYNCQAGSVDRKSVV